MGTRSKATAGAKRVLWLCAGALSAACIGTPPRQTSLSVQLVTPGAGVQLSIADDQDPAAPGIQKDVLVQASDSAGGALALSSAELQTRLPGAAAFTSGPQAVVDGGQVTFPGVTFQDGENELQVTVVQSGSGRTASTSARVGANTTRPVVTRVQFQNDVNGDGVLTLAEQPTGYPVALITTLGLEDGQPVTVKDATWGTVYGTGTASFNAAAVTLSGLPNLTFQQYPLIVTVVNAANVSNNTTGEMPADPLNGAAFTTLTVDRRP